MKKTAVLICLPFLCICASIQADSNNPRVVIQTIFGDIAVELFPEDAPITVDNFLHYVNTGFYDDTVIHRVDNVAGFSVVQGGGYYVIGYYVYYKQPDGSPIVNESYNGLSNVRGTIAMARSDDPNSATSQFYFNQIDNISLDKENYWDGFGYCVFGEVIHGMDVVDVIAASDTADIGGGLADFPIPVVYVYAAFEAPEGYWLKADVNYDGIVDEQDLNVIVTSWLSPAELGDIEVTGNVDFDEFAQFAQAWRQTSGWYRFFAADINNDKKVNFTDFSPLAKDWDQSA
ncbi:MAG: peptidylprolyl isomerase, partial [Phycisphaerales bacterium]